MKKEERYNTFWKYVLLIAGSILILIPLLATVFSSFKTTKDIMQHFFAFPNPVTLSNYTRLLADGIGHYFLNSTIITVVSVILVTLFIPAAAYSIARNMSKKRAFNIMYSLLILGIFVPFQVIMIPITVMMSRLGLTNIWGLIILYLTYAVPQTLFLYVGYIKLSVPDSLDEAAEIDGADKFTTYRKIVFPMLKPMHATTLIINALWFWNDFMLPLLMYYYYHNRLPHFPKTYHLRNEQRRSEIRIQRPYSERSKNRNFDEERVRSRKKLSFLHCS